MKTADEPLGPIKSAVLYDLFGEITKSDLQLALMSIDNDEKIVEENVKEIEKLWAHLTQRNVVDRRGRLLIEDAKLITENRVGYDGNLSGKLVFYLRQVAGRQRRIRIPFHFLSFVELHLDTWLDNAVKALKDQRGERYVVSPSSEPKSVVIIDPDTGTDQTSSQWGEALHQFLQLKEGCLLTLQSLKSVFISNVTYIKRYAKLAGLTGTLGSKPERNFLQTTYKCDYVTVPTAFPRKFTMKPARVVKTRDEWLTAIVEETRQTTAQPIARSLVIFCESIKEVNKVREKLETDLKSELDNRNLTIHSYTRDYEEFVFESSELDVGHVIVATNLAGRGTDIKISEELYHNGGLHICLTYLPDNLRIEEQAFGRAGRKRDPGSGIIIVHDPYQQPRTMNEMKFKRNSKECHRISRLAQDFSDNIRKQEECFRHFFQYFQYLKRNLEQRSKKKSKLDGQEVSCVCNSALDQWALWIDSITSFKSQSLEQLLGRLKTFLNSLQLTTDTKDIDWMTPGRLMVMAKHLATRKTEPNLLKADAIFRKLVKSKDSFFYPAAHYYRAFIPLKEGHLLKSSIPNRKRLICMLQTTEILLREHIAMQKSFSSAVGNNDVYYKRQKENMIKILEYYLESVQSLLGRRCSVSGLIEPGVDATIVDQLMRALANEGVVTCKVNQEIPGGKDIIRQVANNHAVRELSLRKILYNDKEKEKKEEKEKKKEEEEEKEKDGKKKKKKEKEYVFNEFLMKDMLGEVKLLNGTSTVIDHCWTRDKFWNFFSENGALHTSTDNVVVPETEYNSLPETAQIQMDQHGLEGYFFFNTKYRSKKDLEDSKKIMFTRNYLEQKFSEKEYARRELAFESCKFALLDAVKLQTEVTFGKLEQSDLALVNIDNEDDRKDIWSELKAQNIVDQQGHLSSEYNDNKPFNYSKCFVYETSVRSLIEKTFAAEKVRRRWLDESDTGRFFAIDDLPLRSDRDLLWDDLLATHIISGTLVRKVSKKN